METAQELYDRMKAALDKAVANNEEKRKYIQTKRQVRNSNPILPVVIEMFRKDYCRIEHHTSFHTAAGVYGFREEEMYRIYPLSPCA